VIGEYVTFMAELVIGVALWIAPGALGVLLHRFWKRLVHG